MKKILVANRGEIALRVMKTARKMGIRTIAVYSEVDRSAPHVLFADEAVLIGPPPSSQSYLQGEKIIEVAKRLNADGIHPGYGFLSENATFAQAVTDSGLIFIGPDPHAIEVMGSKLAAKQAVKAYEIPLVPGTDHALDNKEEALAVARRIGMPVMIKASAGGGGKGMRIVREEGELAEQMERAISEAQSSFGDGSVFIEKFVSNPRHIEIQVLADRHGNTVHLFERECSIQRRHQKVVEEAPSAILTPELRARMGADAVNVARACDYVGAGTVEFLLDDQHNYYFLEMNTRLQVEHPVTELITGLDLVEQQIRVARGEALTFAQDDLEINGHAIELRVYAEDPFNNFLPSIGKLETFQPPSFDFVRLDSGYTEGMDIPIFYDPMIAKLVTYGEDRLEALRRMVIAINNFEITGPATTLPFGKFVCENEQFISGEFDTNFVKQYFTEEARGINEREAAVAAQIALKVFQERQELTVEPNAANTEWYRNRR